MPTVGLTMIVKDEAGVIARALNSVRPLIDYVLISDTGSSDGTQDVIRGWLRDNNVPGKVIERPWKNFQHNRNEAIDALNAVDGIDYGLTIDADEYLVYEPGFDAASFKQDLTKADGWYIYSRIKLWEYRRISLFSNRLPFRYRHVMHEYLAAPSGAKVDTVRAFYNYPTDEGARNRNPNKHLDDAKVIEKALESETDPGAVRRYTYYLAQCYRAGMALGKARNTYLQRADMGGSKDEVAMSIFNAALLMVKLGRSTPSVITMHLRAFEIAPFRAEPLCAAARLANLSNWHQQAYLFAKAAVDMPRPDVSLFDTAAYDWHAIDELQIAAIGTSRFGEAVELSERLLSEAKFPEWERERIETNAAFALAHYDLAPLAAGMPTSSVSAN